MGCPPLKKKSPGRPAINAQSSPESTPYTESVPTTFETVRICQPEGCVVLLSCVETSDLLLTMYSVSYRTNAVLAGCGFSLEVSTTPCNWSSASKLLT